MPGPRPTPRRLLLAAAAAALCPLQVAAQALPAASRDTLVKAAFLHKFASFVEWPDGTFPRADSPLHIGVLGDDLLWRDLSALARDRQRDGRAVTVTRVEPGGPLTGFHILYIKAASAIRAADLVATVPEGVLTVADSEGGAHPRGSVLSFFVEDERVRFGVSVGAAARQRLRLSPRLIAAAHQVGQGTPETDFA